MRGGPGEAQIELDRRMIGETIKRTKERLSKVKRQRQTQRRQRERRDAFNISLIGYTNAGKSTLFNALVKARAYAADQLFATLDTTTRQLYLGEAGRSVSLSDTVGFIRDLPHGLIDAFQATLQEAIDADLLLHVVDASNPRFAEQIAQVQSVLKEIGADAVPQLLVFNKIDALDDDHKPLKLEDEFEVEGVQIPRIFVSARGAVGLQALRQRLADMALSVAPVENTAQILPETLGDGP
jgi:GTPase